MKILSPLCSAVFASLLLPGLAVDEVECKKFGEIYADGTQMMEKMWDNAFKVVPTGEPSYEQWWFSSLNPNNDVTELIFGTPAPTNCGLEYYHKPGNATPHDPSPENAAQSECLPWITSSCCDENTVLDTQTIKEAYGKNYEWDRCGPISQGCERFFVQEACLYECDVNAGKYRLCSEDDIANSETKDIGLGYNISCNDNGYGNRWQIYNMPVSKMYADAWYRSCENDSFCAADGGSFFSCALRYENSDAFKQQQQQQPQGDPEIVTEIVTVEEEVPVLPGWAIALIVVGGVAVVAAAGLAVFTNVVVSAEKAGTPMFQPLNPGSAA
ncbi:hypothetical protein TeGR_g11819 [Tetraparma gracilis]|uniref:Folate receptor-like domain-containing protein n=1 Tax=Tetraparma gracilis TaxID=2962635 RepID=A0ABQ6M7U4_9STRA|nr:hypothetical protein TeGR_g11819 [Tetraparma gracilis]